MLMVAVKSGIVIFAHGSSVQSANEAVRTVAQSAAAAGSFADVEVAFLEAQPSLDEAVARLASRGIRHILVVPYFLTLGIHLQRDLPGMVERLAQVHQNVGIRCTPPLDGHPAMIQILLDRPQLVPAMADAAYQLSRKLTWEDYHLQVLSLSHALAGR